MGYLLNIHCRGRLNAIRHNTGRPTIGTKEQSFSSMPRARPLTSFSGQSMFTALCKNCFIQNKRCNLTVLLIEEGVKMFQANYSLFDSALHFFRPCHVYRWVSVSYSTAGIRNLPNHANLRMHPSRFLLWRSVTPEKTQQNGKDSIIIFQTSSTRTFKNL